MGKSSAFTLAEILITLTIIGVISATAVPAMVQDVQNQQFKIAWRKAYSDLNQATRLFMNDNGGTMTGMCSYSGDNDCILNKYTKYFSYTKKCYVGEAVGNCWAPGFKQLNGSFGFDSTAFSRVILTNGTMLRFDHYSNNCNFTDTGIVIPICGTINVDINGYSAPNTVGKDIFSLWIQKDGIKPWGTQGDTEYAPSSDCKKSGSGNGCSALYLYQ